LALEAIASASAAFNEGAMAHLTSLANLAVSIDPGVRRTHRWWLRRARD
jgi:hypothetical protein